MCHAPRLTHPTLDRICQQRDPQLVAATIRAGHAVQKISHGVGGRVIRQIVGSHNPAVWKLQRAGVDNRVIWELIMISHRYYWLYPTLQAH